MCVNLFYTTNGFLVPCGHCYECQSKRRSEWSVRNQIELYHSRSAYFLTLTYNEESINELDSCEFTCIRLPKKSHYQNFIKRLRKFINMRYFGVHEYGKNGLRPHYHIIVYLSDDDELPLSLVQKSWDYGFITKDRVNNARIHYVTKYLQKSFRQKNFTIEETLSDLESNLIDLDTARYEIMQQRLYKNTFNFMSTKPAIGYQLLDNKEMVAFIRKQALSKNEYPQLHFNGQSFPLPRYYIKKIFTDYERRFIYNVFEHNYLPAQLKEASRRNQELYQMESDLRQLDDDKLRRFNSHLVATDKI